MVIKNAAYFIAAQTIDVPSGAEGMPGTGKSSLVGLFSSQLECRLLTFIGSITDPTDIGGFNAVVQEPDGYVTVTAPRDWLKIAARERCVIFIDEQKDCPPAMQSALQRLILDRKVGDVELHDKTMVMGAWNPTDISTNGYDFGAPLANRYYHHKWVGYREEWHRALKTPLAEGNGRLLRRMQFPKQEFPILPDNWCDHYRTSASIIDAFLESAPEYFEVFPKERAKQSGPWPSQRSWTAAVTCDVAARSVGADRALRLELLTGNVGEDAAAACMQYETELDLPDPNAIIEWGMGRLAEDDNVPFPGTRGVAYKHPNRGDRVYVMLSAIAAAVKSERSKERWNGAMVAFDEACQHDADLVLANLGDMYLMMNELPGTRMPARLSARCADLSSIVNKAKQTAGAK